jgi:pyridoxine kinase
MKRILTIQDISCVGQCSLTVAQPILSCCQMEACVLPSAILSTHTGGFKGFTFRDLTSDMLPISAHWKKEGITFDGIYTGYLGSIEQIGIIEQIILKFKQKDTMIFIDPAMADDGKLYSLFDDAFVNRMKEYIRFADVIVPNSTEACFLLGREWKPNFTKEECIDMVKELSKFGASIVCLTGITYEENKIGVMAYEQKTNKITTYFGEKIPKMFHGTGDVFASSFFGCLMNQIPLAKSLEITVEFILTALRKTLPDESHWYGVHFEEALPQLILDIQKNK